LDRLPDLCLENPEISQKLGLINAKANLVAYAATDWPTYTGFFGQIIGAGGFILSVFVISWYSDENLAMEQ